MGKLCESFSVLKVANESRRTFCKVQDARDFRASFEREVTSRAEATDKVKGAIDAGAATAKEATDRVAKKSSESAKEVSEKV